MSVCPHEQQPLMLDSGIIDSLQSYDRAVRTVRIPATCREHCFVYEGQSLNDSGVPKTTASEHISSSHVSSYT